MKYPMNADNKAGIMSGLVNETSFLYRIMASTIIAKSANLICPISIFLTISKAIAAGITYQIGIPLNDKIITAHTRGTIHQ